jgi:5-methylthioadenosine/S-adenosylhomocysteine deaminase
MKTLIRGAVVVTCDEDHAVLLSGDLLMDGDRIAYVGDHYDGAYDVFVDGTGRLVMPGFVNAHTHSPMTLFRSLADDVDLQIFLNERVWPREVRLSGEEAYAGSILSGIEMLKSGVTTYADMYFFEEDLARAAIDVGLRAIITPAILETPQWTEILGSWETRTQTIVDFCRRWQGREGRIHTGFGPHAPYTLPLEALAEIAVEARRSGFPVHIHLLETKQERENFIADHGRQLIMALEDADFFDGPVVAAHSVWADGSDIETYAQHSVGVAHCPQSNAKLGAGIAPIALMLARQVQVGLGTDGAATNNNLDLWEELRLAPLLAKVSALDPKPLPARQAIMMATRMGARAIHLRDVGSLQVGFKADVLMLRAESSTMTPIFEASSYIDHVVYAGGRELVDRVWVNGNLVVQGGEVLTVDEEAARVSAQRAAIAVSHRLES